MEKKRSRQLYFWDGLSDYQPKCIYGTFFKSLIHFKVIMSSHDFKFLVLAPRCNSLHLSKIRCLKMRENIKDEYNNTTNQEKDIDDAKYVHV